MKEPEKPKKPERKPEEENIPDPRYDNAFNKQRCGMCVHKSGLKGDWTCTLNPYQGVGYLFDCDSFSEKPHKPHPSQLRSEKLTIPAGVRFIYFGRSRQGERHQGVMTVAYSVDEKNREVKIGFSFCSPKDPWVKAKGQSIALDQIVGLRLHAPYLYEPKREVVEIAQALMEHRWDWLKYYCARNWPGGLVIKKVPCWSKALARRLKTRKVSGISRLKLFERRSFPFPIPTTDSILRAMVQDILTLGGKP